VELNFYGPFFEKKKSQISNFMKILPVGSELFHADGRTDIPAEGHNEANNRFSQFCERPKTHFLKCVNICLNLWAGSWRKDLNCFCARVLWTVPWPMERAVRRWADTDWCADTPTDWLVCWHTNRLVCWHQQTDWCDGTPTDTDWCADTPTDRCADTPTDLLVCWHTNRH